MAGMHTPSTQAQQPTGKDGLRQRVMTALLLAPVVLLLVWLGGAWYALMLFAAGLIMAREWVDIAHDGDAGQFVLHAVAGVSGLLAGVLAAGGSGWAAMFVLLAALAWGGVLWLRARTRTGFTVHHVLGPGYLAAAMFSLAGLRLGQEPCGLHAIFLLLAIIWSADTLAYFTGRALGGPKFAPRISPNKTWSGFFGAVAGGALAGGLFGLATGFPAWPLAVLGAVLGGFEQLGDLFESALKRRFGVKDSGNILPGHGGLLDRLDGLNAAAMLAMLWGMVATSSIGSAACGLLLWWGRM